MKAIITIVFLLSIFFGNHICNAQTKRVITGKGKHQISICNIKDTMIHLSEINKLIDGCDRIIYIDSSGKELKLNQYLIIFSPKDGPISHHFEKVDGDKLSKSLKDQISKLKVGDKITITQVAGVIDDKMSAFNSNAFRVYELIE